MNANTNTNKLKKVKRCASHFKGEITPESAAEILTLADRHSLDTLKQVGGSKRLNTNTNTNMYIYKALSQTGGKKQNIMFRR